MATWFSHQSTPFFLMGMKIDGEKGKINATLTIMLKTLLKLFKAFLSLLETLQSLFKNLLNILHSSKFLQACFNKATSEAFLNLFGTVPVSTDRLLEW